MPDYKRDKAVLEQKDFKICDAACLIKDADTKSGIVTGYFASFGNKDSDGDVIIKGAFAKTIKDNGPDSTQPRIKHLLDHDTRKSLGKLLVLKEDDKGLYYESQVGTHTLGRDFLEMATSGLITEHSIGYRVVKGQFVETPDMGGVYQLMELRLYEGSSLQFWGSNPNTPLTSIKSEQDMIALFQKMERVLKTGRLTDETFAQIQISYDAIGAVLKSRGTQNPEPRDPVNTPFDWGNMINSFTIN